MSIMKSLLWILIFITTKNCRSTALDVVSMDIPTSVIEVQNPRYYSSSSSGILKSHIGINYRTDWNKTLTLKADYGCGITVAIRRLDFRPQGVDKLTLMPSWSATPPAVFSNLSSKRNKSKDTKERTTVNDPGGKMIVNFQTSPGFSDGYSGFELIYTAYSTNEVCSHNQFLCRNGRCIADLLACDGHNHCGDRSDQLHCTSSFKGKNVAAIVIGSVLVVLAVTLLIMYAVRRSRRTRTVIHQSVNPPVSVYPPPQPGTYYPPPTQPYTMYNPQGQTNAGYQ